MARLPTFILLTGLAAVTSCLGAQLGTNGLRLNFRGAPVESVLNYLSEAAGFIIVLVPARLLPAWAPRHNNMKLEPSIDDIRQRSEWTFRIFVFCELLLSALILLAISWEGFSNLSRAIQTNPRWFSPQSRHRDHFTDI